MKNTLFLVFYVNRDLGLSLAGLQRLEAHVKKKKIKFPGCVSENWDSPFLRKRERQAVTWARRAQLGLCVPRKHACSLSSDGL